MKKLDDEEFRSIYGSLATMGINLAVGMAFFAGSGYYIDTKFGIENNLCTLIGAFLGIFYCWYEVWKMLKTSNKKEENG